VRLKLKHIGMKAANAYIAAHHRHHGRVRGCKFCTSVILPCGQTAGIAIVGRVKARKLEDGYTCEITRLCIHPTLDGRKNACSKLYSACARSASSQGYRLIVTYILKSESGDSLKAAGWTRMGEVKSKGGTWSRPSRPREDSHPLEEKVRWQRSLSGE
jgi:hypothetical protein